MSKWPLVALTLSLLSGVSQAQNYVNFATGASHLGADCRAATTCDRRGTSWRFLLGHPIGEDGVFAEIGMFDFGKVKTVTPARSLSLSGAGVGGGLAIRHEIASNWVLVARGGLLSLQSRATSVTADALSSASQQVVTFYAGIGAGFKVHPSMSLDIGMDASRLKFNRSNIDATSIVRTFVVGATLDF